MVIPYNFQPPDNPLRQFIERMDREREERLRQASLQRVRPATPKWAEALDPEMFSGQTRRIIEQARARAVQPEAPEAVAAAMPERLQPEVPPELAAAAPQRRLSPARSEVLPEPKMPAPAPAPVPQQGNLRQALGPHVGGAGGSYVDMMRQHQQTGQLPDMRGMMQGGGAPQVIPTGQSAPQPAAAPGGGGLFGGGLGDRGRYLLGGLGALMQEAGGSEGMLQAHMARFQDAIQANRTRQAAVAMGLPEEVAATAPMEVLTPLMIESYKRRVSGQEPIKVGPDDTLITPEGEVIYQGPGKPDDPNLVTLVSPEGTDSQTFDVSTPDGRAMMQSLLGQNWVDSESIKKETFSELSRMLKERDALRAQDPNHPDLQLYNARIQRLAEGSGMMMTMGPDGSITFAQGDPKALQQAGQYGAQSARDEALANIEFGKQTIGTLDRMLEGIAEDPSRVGLVGSVRRGLQTGVGIATDIGHAFPYAKPLMDFGKRLAEDTIADGQVDEELARELGGDFFDPALSEISLFENTLAITLAKLRQERGRLLKDIYTDAKKDVKITGLTSAFDVQQKLQAVRQLLQEHIRKQEGLIGIEKPRRRYNPETGQLE